MGEFGDEFEEVRPGYWRWTLRCWRYLLSGQGKRFIEEIDRGWR